MESVVVLAIALTVLVLASRLHQPMHALATLPRLPKDRQSARFGTVGDAPPAAFRSPHP